MRKYEFSFTGGPPGPVVERTTGLTGSSLEALFLQGSVWFSNSRIRDPWANLSPGFLKIFQPEKPISPFMLTSDQVVYEDDDLLVVCKPPNLNTVQTAMSDLDNLTRGVQIYLDRIGFSDGPAYQVNAVHRLDMPAQGLVHFGKHKEAEKRLFALFQNRRIRKIYWAQISRLPRSREGEVLFLRDTLEWSGKEKRCCSWLKCLELKDDRELWAASPLTGRPHQLRKHFARYLNPIVGDVMYGNYQVPAQLMLASIYSKFAHPFTGKPVECVRIPSGWGCLGGEGFPVDLHP